MALKVVGPRLLVKVKKVEDDLVKNSNVRVGVTFDNTNIANGQVVTVNTFQITAGNA